MRKMWGGTWEGQISLSSLDTSGRGGACVCYFLLMPSIHAACNMQYSLMWGFFCVFDYPTSLSKVNVFKTRGSERRRETTEFWRSPLSFSFGGYFGACVPVSSPSWYFFLTKVKHSSWETQGSVWIVSSRGTISPNQWKHKMGKHGGVSVYLGFEC